MAHAFSHRLLPALRPITHPLWGSEASGSGPHLFLYCNRIAGTPGRRKIVVDGRLGRMLAFCAWSRAVGARVIFAPPHGGAEAARIPVAFKEVVAFLLGRLGEDEDDELRDFAAADSFIFETVHARRSDGLLACTCCEGVF